jgi:hypothetical protein
MSSFVESYHIYTHEEIFAQNVDLSKLGADTLVIQDLTTNQIFICGHFKEFKIGKSLCSNYFLLSMKENKREEYFLLGDQDMKFIDQMIELNKLLSLFAYHDCFVMCDANTQVLQNNITNTLDFYEKEGGRFQTFEFDFPLYVANKTTADLFQNTTKKLRGTHTSQINKSFCESSCNIDFVIVKPKSKQEISIRSQSYMLQENGSLSPKTIGELTTSPLFISDHAPVLTWIDNLCIGTFNIKGGNTEDASWAEFVPETYKSFFMDPCIQQVLDNFLLEAFQSVGELKQLSNEDKVKKIKSKNFVSKERFSICEVHLHPDMVPFVKVNEDNTFHVHFMDNLGDLLTECYFHYLEGEKGKIYVVNTTIYEENEIVKIDVDNWVKVLLKDLNKTTQDPTFQETRIKYFCEKVFCLLNYYHYVERNITIIKDNLSLYDVYREWYSKNESKSSIMNNLLDLKCIDPDLKLVALQEFPVDPEEVSKLKYDLESIGYLLLNAKPFVIDNKPCETQGAIFVYA